MKGLGKSSVYQAGRRPGDGPTRYGPAVDRYLAAGRMPGRPLPRARSSPPSASGTVLVGVNDTATSRTAVDYAAIEAGMHGWELRLLHVQRAGRVCPPPPDAGARLLDSFAERVRLRSPSLPVTARLAAGAVSSALLSDAVGASLVVVGHRHSAAGPAVGSSVGEWVAAHHTGVVLVARVMGWPPEPGFGQSPIVVGIDRVGATTPAVEFARREAEARGCGLVMLHAGGVGAVAAERAEEIGGVRVHHITVAEDPATALIDFSRQASGLVVGRQVHGGRPAGTLGSVSLAMARHADCPVFLIG